MRATTVLILLCSVVFASGFYMTKNVKYADKDFLMKQKAVLEVLQHVEQREVHTQLWEDSKNFKFEDYYDHFDHVEYVKEFYYMYKHGMLPVDEIFTVYNEEHCKEMMYCFKVMYYAKDWDTFYKTFTWMRFHINEGMFVTAFTMAIFHRNDMTGIVLPAPYEIFPDYFFNSEVIQKAQQYKMQGFYGMEKEGDHYAVYIPNNYTGWMVHTNQEQKISYFTEDIGLNSYYYYYNLDYPFFMGGKEFGLYKDRRGEFFLYQHQQFLARYYLERLSNSLGVIPQFSWWEPIKTGYYPSLAYYNGVHFPVRDNYYHVYTEENYETIDKIEDYEHRIREAIDQGFIVLPDGKHIDLTKPDSIEYLGNLIQCNPDSVNRRFYGDIAMFSRLLLSASVEHFDNYKNLPGVMEQFETSMRDPMFYQLYKRIISFYWEFKNFLPHYTKTELDFPGVKIEGAEVDKLITYFDKFDADITNAVDIEVFDDKTHKATDMKKFGRIAHYQGEDFVIRARTTRLNHVPFTFKLNVFSDKAQKGIVKVFLGPKYDQYGNIYGVNDNRENFFELEHFVYDFVAGKNQVIRTSTDFTWFVKDRTTFFELYKAVMSAYSGEGKFATDMSEAHCGFPERLMLPRGQKGGMPFQFFFMVAPYHTPKVETYTGYDYTVSCGVGSGSRYVDDLPFGYPFDRMIEESYWFTPNMFYYDVQIFHKQEFEVNAIH